LSATDVSGKKVLVLASDFIDEEKAKKMIKVFLTTDFSGEQRFTDRLQKVSEIEKKN